MMRRPSFKSIGTPVITGHSAAEFLVLSRNGSTKSTGDGIVREIESAKV
jgi:hypothetical protein